MKALLRSVGVVLVILCGLSSAALAQQPNIFLNLPGIQGESERVGHVGEIAVYSLSFGVAQSGIRAAGGRASAGRSNFSTITMTKLTDKSSPDLFISSALGKTLDSATITFQKVANETNVDYLTIKLSDVIVSSFAMSSGGDQVTESVSLSYSKIEFTYRPQNPNGSLDTPITVVFDVNKNKSFPIPQ